MDYESAVPEKILRIKMCEKSLTQRFDDSMSSFSSEKKIKKNLQLDIACEAIEHKNMHVQSDKFK